MHSQAVTHTITSDKGLTALVGFAEEVFPEDNPRKDTEPLTTFVAWHRRSDLGDEGFNRSDIVDHLGDGPEDLIAWLIEEHDAALIRPLYLYEHSGQTVSLSPFSCVWDSGQVGFVFITNATVKEHGLSGAEDDLLKVFEDEVKVFDAYLTNDVYEYEIVDEDGTVLDTCGGFVGNEEGCREQAQSALEAHLR